MEKFVNHSFVKVDRATGFFNGLYSGPELDPKTIQVHGEVMIDTADQAVLIMFSPQDREGKIAFLQKAIDVLCKSVTSCIPSHPHTLTPSPFSPAFVQGEVVKVKSSKIVAGQEVEKTNEFLQLLSIAILKKVCT